MVFGKLKSGDGYMSGDSCMTLNCARDAIIN